MCQNGNERSLTAKTENGSRVSKQNQNLEAGKGGTVTGTRHLGKLI